MYIVYDNATNNVLAEYDEFHEAEQRRIQLIGMNPMLAEVIEVIELDRADEAYRARAAQAAAEQRQPA